MSEINTNDLNEQVEVTVHDAEVVTVPIDATLSNSGEAADAKAVGDALALKADADAVVAIKVNGQAADNQGLILIDGSEIPVSGTDTKKISEVLENVTAKTAENIPMSSDPNAKTIAEVVNENAEAIENMQDKTAANIPMDTGSSTTIKVAIESLDQKTVKTINKKGPDADGDVDMSVVPLAENLQSDKMQSIEGAFIQRTSGGNGSVSDGKAYPLHIFGHMERTGYVAEDLDMTVIPMPRTEPDEPITAEIDRDTFVTYVEESGTIDLFYTTEWSADPELYGVTVTGTPVAGDQIKIVYVKEERGTILVAKPERLVATGWNLFNINKGYAKVVRYSSEYGYKIGGGYSSITFSSTLTGERASITPSANGLFNVPGNGYVFVNGGNGTDTYILATWSDWQDGPSTGYWEPYKESGITLNSVIETYMPNGVLAIGTVKDEIDFSAKRAISRIDRMIYSEENLEAAIATGRDYIYDEDYIYIVREEAVINAITIDSEYTVSEHGLEYFTETVMPLETEILYGKNLRDKLERDVLTISAQTLTAEEQAQVRKNIGAMNPPGNNGTEGQLLKTNGDGSTSWTNQGTPSDAQVGTAVSAWLAAHPEATTTVEDGAVSRAKLDADLKAKTDKVATLESAIAAEETARQSNDTQIRNEIEMEKAYRRNADDDLKSILVPFPVSPESKYGTNGQVLRTKGDGKTEWADVGLPTDEQTAEAVEAWLDAHPEATTTVEDGSVTEEKLAASLVLKAVKDYVTPEMYGAVGDGITDDSEAIQSAIGEGNRWVVLCGTYKVEQTISVYDKTAIIFTKGGKIIADCEDQPLFDLDHVTSVMIRGEGSGDPTISGTCGTAINISGTTDWETSPANYAKFIEICDINISDSNIGCACAFHKAVKQVHINNCTLYAKNAVASDGKAIEITIDNSILWCTDENGVCVNISSELGTSRYNEGWNITNCTIDGSGKAFTVSDIFVLQVMNCYIGKNIEIAAPTTTTQTGKINFIGCIIYANITTIAANSGISYFMRIDNCTFITGRIRLNGNTAFVNISNCAFTFSQSQNGVAIQLQDNVSNITVDNIHIDSTFAGGINVTGTTGGNIRISNVMWDKTTEPVYTERAILCGDLMENKSKWAMITPGTYANGDAIATITKRCGQNENGIIIVKARVYEVADDTKTLQIVASGTAVISMPSATGSSSRYILLKSGKNDVMYVCPYYCTTGGTLTITLKANAAVKLDYHGFIAVKRD